MRELTVGELRKALEGVPDSLVVKLGSDSGVDQGIGETVGTIKVMEYTGI